MEVDQIVSIRLKTLQIKYRDVAFDLCPRDSYSLHTLSFHFAGHELIGQPSIQLSEVEAEKLNHASLEVFGVEGEPRIAYCLTGEGHFASS